MFPVRFLFLPIGKRKGTILFLTIKMSKALTIKTQAIDDQTEVVYGMLKLEIIYVNKVADCDMAIILHSGFDCNNDPVQHDIPGKALI
jgi:hypothetical protein